MNMLSDMTKEHCADMIKGLKIIPDYLGKPNVATEVLKIKSEAQGSRPREAGVKEDVLPVLKKQKGALSQRI